MLYVRQSTLHQVLENTESTARQYGLRERAIALGWEASRIVVIDQDLGQSGASVVDRLGFQHLVAEVGLGHVGLVMGLEVSRLARSSLDWHHLLEICTMTGTLILDEDGLYDPATFNDRLLLGLKGTMSEAELHVLKARLRGWDSPSGALVRSRPKRSRRSSGRFSYGMRILATSAGKSTRRTCASCERIAPPTAKIVATVPREKDQPCCRAWSSADAVVSG
jgi:Resolvase, N terminal domain